MNIYLLDDDETREELVAQLGDEGFQASGFSDAASFYAAFVAQPCDIAVVNAFLDGRSSLSVASTLRHCMHTGIVVMSAVESTEIRLQSLECGADAYLSKPVEVRELVAQVRAIHRRLTAAQDPPPEEHKSWALKEGGWVLCDPAGNTLRLTTAERALFLCLTQTRGSPVSRDALISTLGGNPRYADPHRIDVLINRLRQKARTLHMSLPLRSVRSKGYMLAVETSETSHENLLFEDLDDKLSARGLDDEHPIDGPAS
jgi:two-component system, OmpR family, response regulator PhoP